MGIYCNGIIFGIRIYIFTDNGYSNILFEEKYDEEMSYQQMNEAYLFYNGLNSKDNVHFQFFTECSSTLDPNNKQTFMAWQPLSLHTFLEKFSNSNAY